MAPHDRLTTLLDKPTAATPPDVPSVLAVDGLTIAYGGTQVVHGVDLAVGRGQSLALIGESGSGKSTIARALLRLLPDGGRAQGRALFEGVDVLALPERRFRPLRGRSIGFVPQDPGASLNPVRTIGAQGLEAAALLDLDSKAERREAVLETLAQVGLDEPRRVAASYPHELSGGMLQRVLIGLAVLPRPALLVADEPTSALDVTIQKRILDLLSDLQADLGNSLLLITHDLAIAAERADSLVVLKDGTVHESGATSEVFAAPSSAYARRLHADVPSLNPDRYADLRDVGERRRHGVDATPARIEVAGLTKTFGRGDDALVAVDDVSFSVPAGTTHALVGESGSGKTTTIRLLVGLETPDSGSVEVAGAAVHQHDRAELREARRHLQLVYQNPFTSLDPLWKVERLVREPLDRYGVGSRAERRDRVREAVASVGLSEELLTRRPAALSGGQRQRVAIARALVLQPDVLVLDEPTSALDVSVQADIVQLLLRLQAERGLTYLFVSHDLALVRQLTHTVSVMRHGKVVESGPVAEVFAAPEHDYTRTLLASVPRGAER